MLKEIRYIIYVVVIFLFIFLSSKHYMSDDNKKKSYRSFIDIDKKIIRYANNLPILKNDTINITEYVKETNSKKKNLNFGN